MVEFVFLYIPASVTPATMCPSRWPIGRQSAAVRWGPETEWCCGSNTPAFIRVRARDSSHSTGSYDQPLSSSSSSLVFHGTWHTFCCIEPSSRIFLVPAHPASPMIYMARNYEMWLLNLTRCKLSMHPFSINIYAAVRVSTACPSCRRAKGRVHSGQVTSLSHSQPLEKSKQSHSHLRMS